MKTARILFLIAALAPLGLAPAGAQEQQPPPHARRYKIYCVEGAVRIENRGLDELRTEYKGSLCELARTEFKSLSKARLAAKRFGGAGGPCRCASAARSRVKA